MLDPFLLPNDNYNQFLLTLNGNAVNVEVRGTGQQIRNIYIDNQPFYSAVLPNNISVTKINIEMGTPEFPYIKLTNSSLKNVEFQKKSNILSFTLDAFPRHKNSTVINSPVKPKSILLNGEKFLVISRTIEQNNYFEIQLNFSHKKNSEIFELTF